MITSVQQHTCMYVYAYVYEYASEMMGKNNKTRKIPGTNQR